MGREGTQGGPHIFDTKNVARLLDDVPCQKVTYQRVTSVYGVGSLDCGEQLHTWTRSETAKNHKINSGKNGNKKQRQKQRKYKNSWDAS